MNHFFVADPQGKVHDVFGDVLDAMAQLRGAAPGWHVFDEAGNLLAGRVAVGTRTSLDSRRVRTLRRSA